MFEMTSLRLFFLCYDFAKFTKPLKEQKDLYFREKGIAVTLT